MLKSIIYLISFLLIPIVFAIYGGEQELIYHFDKCSSLDVIVFGSLEIDQGEYSFNNCSETNNNIWKCDCYDGFDLIITTQPNTINNYTINITYSYGEASTSTSASYSSGGSNWVCGSWSECVEGNKTIFCHREGNIGINYTNIKQCNITIIEPKPKLEPKPEPEPEPENKTIEPIKELEELEPEPISYRTLIIIIFSVISLVIITLFIIRVIRIRRY